MIDEMIDDYLREIGYEVLVHGNEASFARSLFHGDDHFCNYVMRDDMITFYTIASYEVPQQFCLSDPDSFTQIRETLRRACNSG
jgi:hypothetical protein